MLLDLVSKARSGSSAEIEAMMAERDFFRERYAEQIETIEQLKIKLKESQRVVDKLRKQILDLEMEKGVETNQMMEGTTAEASRKEDPKPNSCVGDDNAERRVGDEHEPLNEVATSDVGLGNNQSRVAPQAINESDIDQASCNAGLDDGPSASIEDEFCNDGEEVEPSSSSDHDENEAEQIRANAERMLQWANYQSSKRSTPNTSMNFDSIDEGNIENEIESCEGTSKTLRTSTSSKSAFDEDYTIPKNMNERKKILNDHDDDDENDNDSFLGSSSSVQFVGTGTGANSRGDKIGKLFNNLRGMIEGPPSESNSEVESDDLSTD